MMASQASIHWAQLIHSICSPSRISIPIGQAVTQAPQSMQSPQTSAEGDDVAEDADVAREANETTDGVEEDGGMEGIGCVEEDGGMEVLRWAARPRGSPRLGS